MSVEDNCTKLLSEFGLTRYEARVYISATRLGITTAGKIAKSAGIRREEVYRTIPRLEKIGLIERILGRPVKLKALPINEGLNVLFEIKEEESSTELRQLISRKEEFLQKYHNRVHDVESEEEQPHFVVVSERDVLSRKVTSLITKARRCVDFADSFENAFRFILSYGDALKTARKKNVKIRILTECPEDTNLIPEYLKKYIPKSSFTVRYSEKLPSRYILFDEREAMITTSAGSTFSDSVCLWTNDSSLVGITLRDFEEQFRESSDWRDLSVTPSEKLNRILKRLKPRDHIILIYDSLESKHNTLFAYIRDGLIQNEAAMYVCSEETPDSIRDAMNRFGIDVNKYESNGALKILPYTDIYIRDGKFDLEDVMNIWSKSYYDALSKGFKGMRVTGETSCFIKHDLIDELIEYEGSLHSVLDIPMTAICAYNADILSEVESPIDIYSELIRAHGKVLFAGHEKLGKLEIRAS